MSDEFDDGYGEQLDRLFAQHRAVSDAYEATAFGRMEVTLETTPAAPSEQHPPMPGEWHPYYEDQRRWLTYWLDNETTGHLRMPVRPPLRSFLDPSPDPTRPHLPRENVLQRHHAWGIAPYVGDPFAYTWWTAVDDYGRWIAGDTTSIRYVQGGAGK